MTDLFCIYRAMRAATRASRPPEPADWYYTEEGWLNDLTTAEDPVHIGQGTTEAPGTAKLRYEMPIVRVHDVGRIKRRTVVHPHQAFGSSKGANAWTGNNAFASTGGRRPRRMNKELWDLLPFLSLVFIALDAALSAVRAQVAERHYPGNIGQVAFDDLFQEVETEAEFMGASRYRRDPSQLPLRVICGHSLQLDVQGITLRRWDHVRFVLEADVVVNERALPAPVVPARTWTVPPSVGRVRMEERHPLFARPPPAAHTC